MSEGRSAGSALLLKPLGEGITGGELGRGGVGNHRDQERDEQQEPQAGPARQGRNRSGARTFLSAATLERSTASTLSHGLWSLHVAADKNVRALAPRGDTSPKLFRLEIVLH